MAGSTLKNLIALREMADWRQWDLAHALRWPRTKVTEFECGNINVGPEEISRIRRILLKAVETRRAKMAAAIQKATRKEENAEVVAS